VGDPSRRNEPLIVCAIPPYCSPYVPFTRSNCQLQAARRARSSVISCSLPSLFSTRFAASSNAVLRAVVISLKTSHRGYGRLGARARGR
jgi:hypothetical protein